MVHCVASKSQHTEKLLKFELPKVFRNYLNLPVENVKFKTLGWIQYLKLISSDDKTTTRTQCISYVQRLADMHQFTIWAHCLVHKQFTLPATCLHTHTHTLQDSQDIYRPIKLQYDVWKTLHVHLCCQPTPYSAVKSTILVKFTLYNYAISEGTWEPPD